MRKAENSEQYQDQYREQPEFVDISEGGEVDSERVMERARERARESERERARERERESKRERERIWGLDVPRIPLYQPPSDYNSFFDGEKATKEFMNNAEGNSGRRPHATANAPSLQYTAPESRHDTQVLFLEEKIKELQSENERLLHRWKRETRLDVNFEVFYHIPREAGIETYLEKPHWAQSSDGLELKANSPVLYPDAYIQYKSLDFIVERHYSGAKGASTKSITTLQLNQISDPIPSWERLRPVSKGMKEAIKLLRKGENPRKTPGILKDEVMVAPYYWWYYYRKQPDIFDNLSTPQAKLIRNLTDWIDANYSELYSQVDGQFERGMVSIASLRFLIRPGDVLVLMDQDSVEAYLASSSIEVVYKGDLHVGISDDHLGGFDGDGGLYAATLPTKKFQQEWKVDAWSYTYSGSFSKMSKKLSIKLPDDTKDTEIPIQDLSVFPLRFASLELRESLEQRGKTFWSCRYRKYISYAKDSKEEHSVGYSKTL
jgi:hypothetical protein